MLQKKNLTTSTTRFASIILIKDYNKPFFKKKLKIKLKIKKNKKKFYNYNSNLVTYNYLSNLSCVVVKPLLNKKPYQLFFLIKSIYSNFLILPGLEGLNSGNKIFDMTKNYMFSKISYLGSQFLIDSIPYMLNISFVSNNSNNKWTFAKSSGTFITKLKAKKTIKLILVELPSLHKYFLKKKTKCFLGKNNNFFNNKFIEGKWGYSIHRFKKINVRGVAMNPVDHPNGGRTKSKQPEKSPWGWIAKHNK